MRTFYRLTAVAVVVSLTAIASSVPASAFGRYYRGRLQSVDQPGYLTNPKRANPAKQDYRRALSPCGRTMHMGKDGNCYLD